MHEPNTTSSARIWLALFGWALLAGVGGLIHTQSRAASPAAAKRDQIASGAALYKQLCVRCHSENLAGGVGPALRGAEFIAQWEGKPMRSLYTRILMTMPGDDPGSLTPPQVLILTSYIASENRLAEWQQALGSANDLNTIIMKNPR